MDWTEALLGEASNWFDRRYPRRRNYLKTGLKVYKGVKKVKKTYDNVKKGPLAKGIKRGIDWYQGSNK